MSRRLGRALALLGLVSLAACQSAESGKPTAPTATPPAASQADSGIVLQSGKGGASLAEACHGDHDCIQPLRCLELRCAVPPAVDGTLTPGTPSAVLPNGKKIWLEVASTEFARQRGLMFRTRMHADWGMLFVFPGEAPRSFWMRNTMLPLDMVFLDGDRKVVSIAADAVPLEEGPRYQSTAPARFVLELNAGRAAELGLSKGQQLVFLELPEAL